MLRTCSTLEMWGKRAVETCDEMNIEARLVIYKFSVITMRCLFSLSLSCSISQLSARSLNHNYPRNIIFTFSHHKLSHQGRFSKHSLGVDDARNEPVVVECCLVAELSAAGDDGLLGGASIVVATAVFHQNSFECLHGDAAGALLV